MRLKLLGQHYEFVINWKLMVFYTLFMPLFLGLGYWQLDRAQEKAELQAVYAARMAADAVSLEQAGDATGYQKVGLSGRYDTRHHFLLDNRTHQGRPGYEVISPFLLDKTLYVGSSSGRLAAVDYVWVNRGWLAMGRSREVLPEIDTPIERLDIEGITDAGAGKGIVLKELPWSRGWPKLIQRVDIPQMVDQLAAEQPGDAFATMVRIAGNSPGALTPIWKPVTMSAEKHLGYALQWFSMSAALTILYFFATLKRVKS